MITKKLYLCSLIHNFLKNMRDFKHLLILSLILLISVVSHAQNEKTIKRKVAIGRFSNETQYGKGMFYDRENDPMQKQATDFLMAKLTQSGKFILLERSDLDALIQEKGETMNKIDADYLIIGSITKYGRKTEGQQKVFSSTKTQTVEAGVSIRIVDAATGLVIYSEEAEGFAESTSKEVLGIGGESNFDATLSDKAISAAISQLVENIIKKCTDQPWRSYILAIDEGSYIISGGASQGISAGDVFNVYAKGKIIKNPQSGADVELPGRMIGTVTVNMTVGDTPETEISFCTYQGNKLDEDNLLTKYYISEK